ncbi:phosphomannomutase/phosphoglucomutase [bacterium]|nr:phosphomannomutase/phosphoglucomutase [bacterium]
MNRQIFREYDIRGLVETDLTPEAVEALGRGIGTYMLNHKAAKISVGMDGRTTSPGLFKILVKGLLSTRLNVTGLGVIPTPLSYYSTHKMAVDGSVMITGSHNPPEYNGFKITLGTSSVYGSEIQVIADIIETEDYKSGDGELDSYDIKPEYIADISERISLDRPVKLAVDCGNGVGGLTVENILKNLGCKPLMLFADVDGRFPNHHPDPTVEKNLEKLKEVVVSEELELGVAYDGDADRIGVVDETGKVLWGDQILAILSRALLEEVPGASIIAEVKCSQLLFDDVEKHGGKGLMWKVGHSLIKAKMHEIGAELAGEMSGHIFYHNRFYGFDDAVYVTMRLLEIVARSEKPIGKILEDWPKLYNTPEIRTDCSDEIKFEVVDKVRDHFKNKYRVVDVDGMRVIMPGGWGLLRASNTQPVVVMRFEADSERRLQEIKTEVEEVLESVQAAY